MKLDTQLVKINKQAGFSYEIPALILY